MEALDALLNRVSAPRLLDPAPTAEQREVLFAAALRAPDHGQLRPYRFLTVEGAARNQLGGRLACPPTRRWRCLRSTHVQLPLELVHDAAVDVA